MTLNTSVIHLDRRDVQHVLLVDIDAVPDFFSECDKWQMSRRPIIPLDKGIFVWCFCRKSKMPLSSMLGKLTFYALLANQHIEIDCSPLIKDDSSAIALTITVGEIHEILPRSIPLTFVGEKALIDEIQTRMNKERNILGISVNEARKNWVSLLKNRLNSRVFDEKIRDFMVHQSEINMIEQTSKKGKVERSMTESAIFDILTDSV